MMRFFASVNSFAVGFVQGYQTAQFELDAQINDPTREVPLTPSVMMVLINAAIAGTVYNVLGHANRLQTVQAAAANALGYYMGYEGRMRNIFDLNVVRSFMPGM